MYQAELEDIRRRKTAREKGESVGVDLQAEEDLALLLGEIERLKANYKVATGEIDNIMLHYKNTLPVEMRQRMEQVQQLVRGLA